MQPSSEHTAIIGFETEQSRPLLPSSKEGTNSRLASAEKKRSWRTGLAGLVAVGLAVLALVLVGVGTKRTDFGKNALASAKNTHVVTGDIAYGGNVASTTTYPFVVRLRIVVGANVYTCTGNILSRKMVLTAAHCLDGAAAAGVTVYAGSISRAGAPATRQVRTASQLIQHPDWIRGIHRDVAFIEVNPPFDMTSSVNIIGEGSDRPPDGLLLTSSGWGVDENGNFPDPLKFSTSNVLNLATCRAAHIRNNVDAFEICTRGGSGNTCPGDSGGPLLWQRNGINELVGLNSYSETQCSARDTNIDVYESVPSYLAWIRSYLPTVTTAAVSATSCSQACPTGSSPIESGIYRGVSDRKFLMCAANYKNEGFRGGFNLVYDGFSNACRVGHGSNEIEVTDFRCLCSTKLVAFIDSSSSSCKSVCGARNTNAVETGVYTDNSKFYACAANTSGNGYRGGFNLDKAGFSDKCYVGEGGKEVAVTSFKCICV